MGTIPPYSAGPQVGAPQDDPEGTALYDKFQEIINDPQMAPMKSFLQAVLHNIPGPPYSHQDIEDQMTKLLSGQYGTSVEYDAYMEFNLNHDMLRNNFTFTFYEITTKYQDSYLFPDDTQLPWTLADQAYGAINDWVQYNSGSGVAPLAEALLDSIKNTIGSGGIPSQIPNMLTGMLADPNFFTNYPMITPAAFGDLQGLVGAAQGFLPDFELNYLNAYYNWPNPTGNTDDTQLQQGLLNAMRGSWTTGSLNTLQIWAATTIILMAFDQYPKLDLAGAQNLETILGIPPPQLQNQFFATRAFMAEVKDPAAYAMAGDLMQEILVSWPLGSPSGLQSWYTSTYGTQDPFMRYYNVEQSDIETFYQIANNTTGTIQPTTTDANYRDVMSYRDTPGLPADDYQLMDVLRNEWGQYGSNPTAVQQTAITKWAMKEVQSSLFLNATVATQQKFLSHLDYAVTLSFFTQYLVTWGGPSQPGYIQRFAESMRSIISGYIGTHPTISQADFQSYLNTNYSQNDFCFQFPGLSRNDVNTLFTTFGLQNPHVYGVIDDAYLMLVQYVQKYAIDPSSPDGKAIDAFYHVLVQGEAAYDPKNPNVDLFKTCNAQGWIANLKAQKSVWDGLLPTTQQLFNAISQLEPSAKK